VHGLKSLVTMKPSAKPLQNGYLDKIAQTPKAKLLVPTGTTPEGLYALLAEQPQATFDGVTFFNLDEYCEPDSIDYRFKPTCRYRLSMFSSLFSQLLIKLFFLF
jgi:6-phosphogluconolactonase/glucosamine-6-phosphate isomerase/deaminase